MGYGPDQVDQWEVYQVTAIYRAWREVNAAPSGPKPPTPAEYYAAIAGTVH